MGSPRSSNRSDKTEGPTSGCETVDPLELLARLVAHIPDKGQVMQRYYGWYANRTRGIRRRQAVGAEDNGPPVVFAEPVDLSRREARRRWAELLRRIYEVDPLRCPRCRAEMRIIAFVAEREVIERILTHVRTRRDAGPHPARAPPERPGPLGVRRRPSRARTAPALAPTAPPA